LPPFAADAFAFRLFRCCHYAVISDAYFYFAFFAAATPLRFRVTMMLPLIIAALPSPMPLIIYLPLIFADITLFAADAAA